MDERTDAGGTAKLVKDYNLYREGDVEPHLGKRIEVLVFKDRTFIVYLDEDCYVEWAFTDDHHFSEQVGRILNRVSELQALPTSHLTRDQLTAFRQLTAEAVARGLQGDLRAAQDALERAVGWLEARNAEVARWWYLSASSFVALLACALLLTFWLCRERLQLLLGRALFEVAMAAGAGAVGAFLSILLRARAVEVDPGANRRLHHFEGVARILGGAVGAAVIALAVKGDLLMGVVSSTNHPFAVLLLTCMAAGASERLVPAFIQKVEVASGPSTSPDARDSVPGQGTQGAAAARDSRRSSPS